MTIHTTTVDGCCAAMMPDASRAVDGLGAHVESFLGHLSPLGRNGVLGLMWSIEAVALASEHQRLHALDATARQRVLERIGRMGVGRDALDAVKASVSLVAGAHRHADEM